MKIMDEIGLMLRSGQGSFRRPHVERLYDYAKQAVQVRDFRNQQVDRLVEECQRLKAENDALKQEAVELNKTLSEQMSRLLMAERTPDICPKCGRDVTGKTIIWDARQQRIACCLDCGPISPEV